MSTERRFLVYGSLVVLAILMLSVGQIYALNGSFQVINTGANFTEIEFNLPEIEIIPVDIDGITYHRLFHPEAGFIGEEGFPEMLSFSTILIVPNTGSILLGEPEITDTNTMSNVMLFPFQGLNLEIDEKIGFLKDEAFYGKDIPYGENLTKISSPAIMRDYRIVSVTVNPFTFNPARNELTMVSRLIVRVNYDTGMLGENELTTNHPRSRAFERVIRGSASNFGQFNHTGSRQNYQVPHILMIYHNTPTFVDLVNQFADWKRDKGFKVTVTSTAGMTTMPQIQNYIQTTYNNLENRPEYVTLIGGFPEIPTSTVNATNGDTPYSLLAGNDIIPDVFIGRIPASSQTDLATVWNKIRNYEREPHMTNTAWYNRALLVGDRYASSLNMGKYVKDVMSDFSSRKSFFEHYSVGASTNFSTQINQGINQGITFFMYRGYIGMSNWSPSEGALNNGLQLFNGTLITCGTLNTSASSHAVTTVNLGTPTASKGGITAIGMFTGGTNSAQNNCIQAAVYYGIFIEDLQSMGEALLRAKVHLWNVYSTSGVAHTAMSNHIHWSNLIGDPSMDVWREIPKVLNVTHPVQLPKGSNSIRIVVNDNNDQPVKDAWVTLRQGNDNILTTGYTDATGTITHYFPATATGIIKATVTKFDYKPHLGSFTINADNPAVAFNEVLTNTDFIAGTQVNFGLSLKNYRNQQVTGVNGSISTASEYINIITNSSGYGNIASDAVAQSAGNYTIAISPDTPANYAPEFNLTVTDNAQNSWLSRFKIPIQNGNLELMQLVISDGNNGILEPGEQAQLRFHLRNTGQRPLTNVYGRLSGGGSGFNIMDSTAHYGNIAVDQTVTSTNNHIEVSVSTYVIPGMMFDFDLHLFNEDGFSQHISKRIEMGIVRVTDPLGPDDYGYWAYDEGDIGYVDTAVYDWIEIVPQLGGNGVNTNLQSDHNNVQQTMTMDLPFTYSFYGEEYDVISICANGWVSFKPMEEATQRNWRIPGPKVPKPVIAVFWDNISLAQGGVFTYFNQDDNIFIVQWNNTQNINNNAINTFQLILYDPMYYRTLTNDGPLKMQYRVFNNVNNQAGSPHGEWGNYASVGIADHTGKIGLEYTFSNRYPTAARALGNQTALYWTTGLSAVYVAIENFSFVDDNNNLPEYGESGNLNITLINLGVEDGFNITATLSTEDQYITITQNQALFGDMESQQSVNVNNAYSISIADNVPHDHRAQFKLNITATDNYEWDDIFFLPINAPKLTANSAMVNDPQPGGNNNGLIDPGEQLTLFIPLVNEGGTVSPDVTFNIISNNNLATIQAISETEFTGINPNDQYFPEVTLAISEAAETGDRLSFTYTIESGNYFFEGEIVLGVGGLIPIQLGEGNTIGGVNSASPINVYFRSLRSQTIYTAAELEAAGMSLGLPMPMTSMGYYIASAPAHSLLNFIIRMKHTTETVVSAHDFGPYTTVFSPDQYQPAEGGWDLLDLNEPFVWNGVDNILVDTAFSPVQGWSSTGQVRIYQQENGFRFSRADNPDQTGIETNTVSADKPQVLLMMGADPEAAAKKPQNLTAEAVVNVVQLQWEAPPPDNRSNFNDDEGVSNRRNRSGIRDTNQANHRNPDGYNVYRNGQKINEALVEALSYQDRTLNPDIPNYYYVTAKYGNKETLPSNVAVVVMGRVTMPHISPEAGAYTEPIWVTITTETEDATIYYTLDGSEPTEDDFLYEEPFEIVWHTRVRASAFKDELVPSNIAAAQYYILHAPQNVKADAELSSVTLSWIEPGPPEDRELTRYRRSQLNERERAFHRNILGYNVFRLDIDADDFVKLNEDLHQNTEYLDDELIMGYYDYYVITVYEYGESLQSDIIRAYVGIVAPPAFSPEPGEYSRPVNITITSITTDASIYYTLDGTRPTMQSMLFTGNPILIDETTNVRAIGYRDGWEPSTITNVTYIITTTSTEDETTPAIVTQLHNAYPNPFNPETTIHFSLKDSGRVKLEIYNINGQKVKTIVDDYISAGNHRYIWQGDDSSGRKVSSGIFFYRLTTADYTAVRKVVLLK